MSKTFSQLRNELNEADKIEPTIGDLSKKEVKTMNKGEPKIGRITKSITNAPKNEPTIGDIGSKTIKQPPKTPSKLNTILSKAGKVAKEIPSADVKATNKIANAASSVGQKAIDKISSSPIVNRITSNPALRGVSKVAGPLTALDVGLGAGELTRKALNTVGPSVKGDKVKSNAKSGLVFKGDVPTLPKEFPNKSTSSNVPRKSISQSELGSALRGEPQTLKSTSSSTNITPQAKPVSTKTSVAKSPTNVKPVTKSPLPKEAPNKVTPKGKVTNEPMRKSSGGNSKVILKGVAPKMTSSIAPKPAMKAIPTRKPEADPNKGPGFVTAGISKGPKGELRPVNVARGKSEPTTLPHKVTSFNQPLQKASNISYSSPKSISAPTKQSPSKAMGTASVQRSSSKSVSGGKWV